MNFIVDSKIARLVVTSVKFGCPQSDRSDSSFEERRKISTSDRLETRSRRSLRCVAKRGNSRTTSRLGVSFISSLFPNRGNVFPYWATHLTNMQVIFRRRGASSAFSSGIPNELIKMLGD